MRNGWIFGRYLAVAAKNWLWLRKLLRLHRAPRLPRGILEFREVPPWVSDGLSAAFQWQV